MRDIATYEANMCDSIGIKDTLTSLHDLLIGSRKKLDKLSGQNDKFFTVLMKKVEDGVNEI